MQAALSVWLLSSPGNPVHAPRNCALLIFQLLSISGAVCSVPLILQFLSTSGAPLALFLPTWTWLKCSTCYSECKSGLLDNAVSSLQVLVQKWRGTGKGVWEGGERYCAVSVQFPVSQDNISPVKGSNTLYEQGDTEPSCASNTT